MTGTNIPEGHRRALESLTSGDYGKLRDQAGILADARLHHLRHRFASHAVLRGIPLPVVSRLLGHKRASMTLRYPHVANRETEAAAERIGLTIKRALDGSRASHDDRSEILAMGPPMRINNFGTKKCPG